MRLPPGLALAALALAAGCAFDPSGVRGQDGAESPVDGGGGGPDGGGPGADAPMGPPDAARPDAEPCVTQCLDAQTLLDCETGGPRTCPLGCDGAADRCWDLDPSNGLGTAGLLTGVSGVLSVASGETLLIDSDTGVVGVAGVEPLRGGGTGLIGGISFQVVDGVGAFGVAGLVVADGAFVQVWGENAFALVSAGDVEIHGIVDVSANCIEGMSRRCGGPGAGDGSNSMYYASGCAAGGDGYSGYGNDTGAGGGGLGEDGAPGGDDNDHAGGVGGDSSSPECPGPALVPLRGGSGGGQGGGDSGYGGDGGGGGGAVQITSMTRIEISRTVTGPAAIWAAGGGGRGGTAGKGGGGGGSGGAILLEAPEITIAAGILAANGGGGGQGNGTGDGQPGTLSSMPAAGGGTGNGAGGAGGSRTTAPQPGAADGDGWYDGTGGGGGGVGIIRLNVPAGSLSRTGDIVSPMETRGDPALI